MKTNQIRAMFTRRLEAMVRKDARASAADFADDCVLESLFAGTVTGRAAVEEVFRAWFAAFPDTTAKEEDEPVIFADRAVHFVTLRGTDTGGFLGQAPTGRPFSLLIVVLCTYRNQQIVHERRLYDFSGLLLQLAGESGAAFESARLYKATLDRALLAHDISIASAIQQALLPPAKFAGTNFEIATASIPCRAIGGDFVDYFELPTGAFGFVLGDVAGKGPPAALLAGVLQGILAGHAPSGGTPAETLTHVNQVLLRRAIDARFATAAYGALSCAGELTYCNAGHIPPFLLRQQGQHRFFKGGLILGAFRHATFDEETVQLECGDLVVAVSDGITEATNRDGEEFGEHRLLACIEAERNLSPGAYLDLIFERVREFTSDSLQQDDLTALVLRYAGAS
jgi:serine phosphatase RsbU (regulator of sigma subunit)